MICILSATVFILSATVCILLQYVRRPTNSDCKLISQIFFLRLHFTRPGFPIRPAYQPRPDFIALFVESRNNPSISGADRAKARDKDKKEWCSLNGIRLVEFNYNEEKEDWISKI